MMNRITLSHLDDDNAKFPISYRILEKIELKINNVINDELSEDKWHHVIEFSFLDIPNENKYLVLPPDVFESDYLKSYLLAFPNKKDFLNADHVNLFYLNRVWGGLSSLLSQSLGVRDKVAIEDYFSSQEIIEISKYPFPASLTDSLRCENRSEE